MAFSFSPGQADAMSAAFRELCAKLDISEADEIRRMVLTEKLIELARAGVMEQAEFCSRILGDGAA